MNILGQIDMPDDVSAAVNELRRVLSAHAMAYGLCYIGVKERPEGIMLMADEMPVAYRIAMLKEVKEICDKIIIRLQQ